MGCGASVENEVDNNIAPIDRKAALTKNNNETSIADQNGHIPVGNGHVGSSPERKKEKKNTFQKSDSVLPPIQQVPKSVAFDVTLDNNIDKILCHQPPKRLKRLQPIENAPRLTTDQLEEKLRQAEEKRHQELEKRKLASKKSSSRLRNTLQRAQEFEKTQQIQQAVELEEKLKSAGKIREAQMREKEEKRKLREERAKQIRERALKLKQANNGLEFDVEKDENFNVEEEDSWLDGDNNKSEQPLGDRIYSGRESPHKQAGRPNMEFRGLSASTTDSFDYAFQRNPAEPLPRAGTKEPDEFFDS